MSNFEIKYIKEVIGNLQVINSDTNSYKLESIIDNLIDDLKDLIDYE